MTLQVLENFSDYAFADVATECLSRNGPNSISSSGPRVGAKALYLGSGDYIEYAIAAASTIRFAMRLKIDSGSGSNRTYFSVLNGSTMHVSLGVDGSGYLRAWFDSVVYGIVLGTAATSPLSEGTWYHIEGKIVIHDSTGSIELRVNGNSTPVLNLSGLDTKVGSSTDATKVRFGSAGSSSWHYLTDLAVWNESGESPTGWIGDCRVDTLNPSAAGSVDDWTPSAGANYECVDEANVDGDTSYVESSTNAQKDLYAIGNLPHNPSAIHAVMVTAKAKKTDAGSASVKLGMKSSATEAQGSAEALTEGTYVRYQYARGVDPNTSAAWTTSGVNALEVGVEAVI